MPEIFISYRRGDSRHITERVYDRLTQSYGRSAVFKDVDNIPVGIDFSKHIFDSLKGCKILVAVIGRQWLSACDESGGRRIEDENDYVRCEIATALSMGIPVIPLLVDDASMPAPSKLPTDIRRISGLNAAKIRSDPDFEGDVEVLRTAIESLASGIAVQLTQREPRRAKPSTNCFMITACCFPVSLVYFIRLASKTSFVWTALGYLALSLCFGLFQSLFTVTRPCLTAFVSSAFVPTLAYMAAALYVVACAMMFDGNREVTTDSSAGIFVIPFPYAERFGPWVGCFAYLIVLAILVVPFGMIGVAGRLVGDRAIEAFMLWKKPEARP
jgi:TIR domain